MLKPLIIKNCSGCTFINGKYYLTHYSNVVMIADPEQGALNYGDVSWQGVEE